jgi:hypothetical protein
MITLLVGCGPTYTAGTKGVAAKDLAVLSIPQLPGEAHVQIKEVQFDGAGDQYTIGNSRDFYLLPGDHSAAFTLVAHVPGIEGMFIPSSALTIRTPKAIPLGTFAASKTYELAPPTAESFDQLLDEGHLSLVREKAK